MPKSALAWPSGATLAVLQQRAQLTTAVRDFFAQRQVLEVHTPILGRGGSTDAHLASLSTQLSGLAEPVTLYLQTSPEFLMKRLLACGIGPIYQLGPCFRDGEISWRHNPEFWMLEWYRPGWTLAELEAECCALVDQLLGAAPYRRLTYREAFVATLGLDPFQASLEALRDAAHHCSGIDAQQLDRDGCLDLLISHQIEPSFQGQRVVLYDFPASQAALAQIHQDAQGDAVAARFELYINGIEIANAYQELTSAQEQAARFHADQQQRALLGLPAVPADQHLLAALEAGLPECSGIALGFDRLVMLACNTASLDATQAFSVQRC